MITRIINMFKNYFRRNSYTTVPECEERDVSQELIERINAIDCLIAEIRVARAKVGQLLITNSDDSYALERVNALDCSVAEICVVRSKVEQLLITNGEDSDILASVDVGKATPAVVADPDGGSVDRAARTWDSRLDVTFGDFEYESVHFGDVIVDDAIVNAIKPAPRVRFSLGTLAEAARCNSAVAEGDDEDYIVEGAGTTNNSADSPPPIKSPRPNCYSSDNEARNLVPLPKMGRFKRFLGKILFPKDLIIPYTAKPIPIPKNADADFAARIVAQINSNDEFVPFCVPKRVEHRPVRHWTASHQERNFLIQLVGAIIVGVKYKIGPVSYTTANMSVVFRESQAIVEQLCKGSDVRKQDMLNARLLARQFFFIPSDIDILCKRTMGSEAVRKQFQGMATHYEVASAREAFKVGGWSAGVRGWLGRDALMASPPGPSE